MQTAKKSFSLLIAIVMLISVFSFGASAGAPDLSTSATAKVGVAFEYLHEDGTPATYVKPGETITVNVYATSKTDNDDFTKATFMIYFDSSVYSYVEGSRTFEACANVASPASAVEVVNSGTPWNNVAAKMTDEDKAHGWDSALSIQVLKDGTNTNSYFVKENSDKVFLSAKFKVADVAEGTTAHIGAPQCTIYAGRRGANYNYIQTKAATAPTNVNLVLGDFTREFVVSNGEAPAAPVLTKGRAQYKMETLVPGVSVADNFQYRVLSTISKADWEANFENTAVEGATTKALTEVGFIAADTATFDLNTAKTAVIANTTGDYTTGLPAGYKAATTNHIYRTDGDATFACRVDTSKDTCADLTYIAFAKYLDADGQPQVIFYDAAATVLLKSSYDELVNRWLGR